MFLRALKKEFLRDGENRVTAVADLKVRQVVEWRENLVSDAQAIARNPFQADRLQEFLSGATDSLTARFSSWLETERVHNQGRRALVVDSKNQVRLVAPAGDSYFGSNAKAFTAAAMGSNQVFLSDLHRRQTTGYIHLDLVVPLRAAPAAKLEAATESPMAALDCEVDPAVFLYPLLRSWPTAERSGETYLVRGEGNDVLFLNELRQRTNTALRLRLPSAQTDNIAARTASGFEGLVQGLDYRGEPVLACVRKVPGTTWCLIAKIDQAEVFAGLKTENRLVAATIAGFLATTLLVLRLLWRRQEAGFLHAQLASEKQRQALAERLLLITRQTNDIIFLFDKHEGIIDANDRAETSYGYSCQEFRALKAADLCAPQTHSQPETLASKLKEQKSAAWEILHRRKNGSLFLVEASVRLVELQGEVFFQAIIRDITERKATEQKLVQLSRAVEQSPASIVITDARGTIEYVNPKFCELTGYSSREAIGQNPRILKSGQMSVEGYRQLWASLSSGREWRGEFHNRKKNGELYWEFASISPIRNSEGRVTHFVAVKEDITERKRAEESLRLLGAAVEQTAESVIIMEAAADPEDSKIVFVNPAFSALRGYAAEEVLGKPVRCLHGVQGEDGKKIRVRQTLERGEIFQDQAAFLRKDGSELQMEWVITPLRDGQNRVTHFVSVQRDITQREHAERERTRLAAIIEATPDYVSIVDARSQRLIYMNRAARRMVGIGMEDDISALKVDDLVPPEKRRLALEEILPAVLRTGVWTGEAAIAKRGGGEIPVLMAMMAHRSDNGHVEILSNVSRDITERKQAESELKALHQQLVETARLAGMAEVATSVLHNVGNVLSSIVISSSLVCDKVKASKSSDLAKAAGLLEEHAADLPGFFAKDPKARLLPKYLASLASRLGTEQKEVLKELGLLMANIDHVKEIIAMQQGYARVAGVVECLPVTDLIEDALRINAAGFERHQVEVVREYADLPPIRVEKHKVLQILVNLLRNAKYALDGASAQTKRLLLRTEAADSRRLRISIIDNGVGIPQENLKRIFELGFTTRKEGHGFGLHNGALVAQEMGGDLRAYSDGPGRGATFVLELPRHPSERNV